MSTHVSLRGNAARTISHSIWRPGGGWRGGVVVVVVVLRVCGGVETIKRRIFPATSKQLTDHRPEGSVSTTQDVNGRLSEQELRCQSVHHPLSLSLSLQVSFHHGVNLRHCYVRRKRKKNPATAKETLTWRASSLFIIPSSPKKDAWLLRVDLCADLVSTHSFLFLLLSDYE